ncbi:MAG TPA: PAS domain S-box protein, partial [Acidimicrobiales bacterium]|nr:PAS domain S-box protein [Acidimicrobiales bacterium]
MSALAPLREAIDLEPQPESAGAGRRFLRVTLTSWALPEDTVEQAVQVAAELVTNAILHAGTPLTLEVSYAEPLARVSVRDYSPVMAALRAHRPDAMTGRGLDLVAAISQAWGVQPRPDGKVVWAEVNGQSYHAASLTNGSTLADDLSRPIRFLSIPVADCLAMAAHHDAMLREVELSWLDGNRAQGATTPDAPELLQLARTVAGLRDLLRRAVEAAAAEEQVRADVELQITKAELRALRDWLMAMEEAEELCRSGQVLAPPASAEIVALRRSLLEFAERELIVMGEVEPAVPDVDAVEALRLTFEHAPIGMAMVSLEGHFLYVNRALCEIVGRTEEELRGMTFQAITHPSDLQPNLDLFDEALTGGLRTYELEKRYVHADGHEVPVLLSVALARDPAGRPRHFISQIQDLSARKQAEAALAASEERLRQVSQVQLGLALEATGMGAWDVDLSTGDIRWTRSLDELLGYSPQSQSHAMPLLDVVHPDDRAAVQAAVEAARRTGEPHDQDFRVLRPDGSVGWMLVKIRVRRGADGAATHVVGVLLDVTDQRQVEESLRIERTAAQSAAWRLARLQTATARLSEVRSLDDVAKTILAEVTRSLAADQAGLWLLGRDGKTMRLVG